MDVAQRRRTVFEGKTLEPGPKKQTNNSSHETRAALLPRWTRTDPKERLTTTNSRNTSQDTQYKQFKTRKCRSRHELRGIGCAHDSFERKAELRRCRSLENAAPPVFATLPISQPHQQTLRQLLGNALTLFLWGEQFWGARERFSLARSL